MDEFANIFDNEYFQLLDKHADQYKSVIKNTTTEQRQYEITYNDETLMMLHTDLALIHDDSYRKIVAVSKDIASNMVLLSEGGGDFLQKVERAALL